MERRRGWQLLAMSKLSYARNENMAKNFLKTLTVKPLILAALNFGV